MGYWENKFFFASWYLEVSNLASPQTAIMMLCLLVDTKTYRDEDPWSENTESLSLNKNKSFVFSGDLKYYVIVIDN